MFLGAHCAYGQAGLRRRWIVRLHKILHTLALRAFYLGRRSYASCLEISGLSPGRFEALIRQCGPALALALDRMSPKTKGRPRARRVKGRLPSNQEQGAVLATPQLREMLLQN